jgi:hypothetical protein
MEAAARGERDLEVEARGQALARRAARLRRGEPRRPVEQHGPSWVVDGGQEKSRRSKQFASGTTHKRGPQLLTPGMIANEMQFIGGKKT